MGGPLIAPDPGRKGVWGRVCLPAQALLITGISEWPQQTNLPLRPGQGLKEVLWESSRGGWGNCGVALPSGGQWRAQPRPALS